MCAELHENKCQSNHARSLAYIVKVWPRLSQTFVLNEILSLEQRGVPIRIYSTRQPDPGPAHAAVGRVRAPVTCLSLVVSWRKVLPANGRCLSRQPRRYLRVLGGALAAAVKHRRLSVLWQFLQAGGLAEILHREPARHLHAHFATAPALVAMFTHELTGLDFSFTAHAKDIYVDEPDMLEMKVRQAVAVLTRTQYNRRFLVERFGPLVEKKIHCIYHGLDVAQFPFREIPPAQGQAPLILAVARLVEKKGLEDLIAAADILRRRGRSFQVELIGEGIWRRNLERCIQNLGLGDWVKLRGAQTHDMVRAAHQRAAMFVLPCVVTENGDRDGIPNVLLEAMASGVPVISTPVSGIPELIDAEVNGLLTPPHDPTRLAEAITRLMDSQEYGNKLARAARAKIESTFSLKASAAQLETLFAALAPVGRAGGAGAAAMPAETCNLSTESQ